MSRSSINERPRRERCSSVKGALFLGLLAREDMSSFASLNSEPPDVKRHENSFFSPRRENERNLLALRISLILHRSQKPHTGFSQNAHLTKVLASQRLELKDLQPLILYNLFIEV